MTEIIAQYLPYLKKAELLYREFTVFTKANPVVGGMFGMWVLGVVTYTLRAVPSRIFAFLNRYLSVSVTLNSTHESFHHFVAWFEKNKNIKYTRTLRVTNGQHGWDATRISVGFGNHWFFHKGRPYVLNRVVQSADGGSQIKEEITVKTIGFTQTSIINLIKGTIPERKDKRHVYTLNDGGWCEKQDLPERSWDSVILKAGQKERIADFIQEFTESTEWYKQMGINHRTGILLSGPPGTGKTSVVKALAKHLNKNLCVLSCNFVTEVGFANALAALPKDSVLLLEDFDSIKSTQNRTQDETKNSSDYGISLSGLLNAIDGIFTGSQRIIIATTNHPEKIDSALLRPGRFDLHECIGYADKDMALRMFRKFYPEEELNDIQIAENISMAQIENCFLLNKKDPNEGLKALKLLKEGEYKKPKIIYATENTENPIKARDVLPSF